MEFFVGGLPFDTTPSDLAAFARSVVELNAAMVVTDRDTGRSKGFGRSGRVGGEVHRGSSMTMPLQQR
jgi:hypothetical protein